MQHSCWQEYILVRLLLHSLSVCFASLCNGQEYIVGQQEYIVEQEYIVVLLTRIYCRTRIHSLSLRVLRRSATINN